MQEADDKGCEKRVCMGCSDGNVTQKSHGCCSPAGAALSSQHSTQVCAVSVCLGQVLGVEVCW